jgi:hypothetical protein
VPFQKSPTQGITVSILIAAILSLTMTTATLAAQMTGVSMMITDNISAALWAFLPNYLAGLALLP